MFTASWSDLVQNWISGSRFKKTWTRTSIRRRTRPALRQATVESLEERLVLSAIVVTGTGDSIAVDGFVTLTEALTSINAGVNVNTDVTGVGAYGLNDTVLFNIAGPGVHTILQGTALPTIVKPVIIDGYSQLGATTNTSLTTDNAVLLIELDGSGALPGINGLVLGGGSGGSVISGLVINGFSGIGIEILSDANTVTGNFIGTDVTGNLGASPSGTFGIAIDGGFRNTIGGTAPADRNVIGGNSDGINLNTESQSNVIQGNFIGVGADGISVVGNRLHGIALRGNGGLGVQNNEIGGIAAGTGNIIANNGLAGVAVFGSALSPRQNSGNSILGNSIYNNGLSSPATIPGIDLTGDFSYPTNDGVTPNDTDDDDTGPNELQNYPVLTSAESDLVSTTIIGSLNSHSLTTYRIEFFSVPTVSGTGFGEGQTFLGFANVTTDINGDVNFTATVPTTVPNGQYVTATATAGGTTAGTTPGVIGPSVLGAAESFVILAGSTITSTGATVLIGDVGLSPGSAIVGTIATTGTIHIADAVAVQAKAHLVSAFNYFAGLTPFIDLTGQELGGLTLTPGIYHFDTSAQLTGPLPLILDTLGDPHAVFVFQIGSTLTTAVGSSVVVAGGPDDSIFWQVGSSATIGVGSDFAGNILAQTSITFGTGATLATGRALAIDGAVTLDGIQADSTTPSQSNTSEFSAPVQAGGLTVTLSVAPQFMAETGGTSTVTATLSAISAQDVTVNLTFGGTASNPSDYTHSGSQIVIAAGSLTGTILLTALPDALSESDETIIVDISDVTNGMEDGIQQVIATIIDFGVSPVAMPDAYTVAEDAVLTVNAATGVLANDTDADLDPLTASLDFGPAHGTLVLNPNGSFTYTPDATFSGADSFIYHANDGTSNSAPAMVTLTITSVNDGTPVAVSDAYAATEDTVLTVNAANGVLINDTDLDGDPLTAILDVGPANGTLTFNPDGSFVYTPDPGFQGADAFTYHANDGIANSLPAIVTLTIASVNDGPPVAVSDAYAATEDTVLTVTAASGVLANDTDVDGDPLTAILDFAPVNGTLVLNPNGSFVYTPVANFHGADTFIYHANDGTGNSAPIQVTITVASVNDGSPVALPDAYATTENTVLTVNGTNGVLVNDTDLDGDPLTAILDVGPANGTLTFNPDGSFVYTPDLGFQGADAFAYHANDGTSNSSPAVVTLTISNTSNVPPLAMPDAYAASEDTVLTVNAATGVLANDIDADGDPLTAILDFGPDSGTLAFNPDGSFTYTPSANFHGADSFVYHISDGQSISPSALVTLSVASVNDAPPIALPDAYTTLEDTVLTVNAANGVLTNDTDVDGDPLTAILDVGPTHGTLVFNSNGSFIYTPTANYHGADSFTYHANDGTNSPPTVVTLTIASVNDAPPVTASDVYSATEDTVLTVTAANGVLANDTDVDGDPLTASLDIGPAHGTLVLNPNGSFVYSPASNYQGVDSFVYHANDGTANSPPALVTLTVASVNDGPPVAVADIYAATEDTVLTVNAASGVLANDTDVDSDPLTAILDVGPTHGTLVFNANGSFVYSPNANFHGVDTFTYHANDGTANSVPTLVTLTIASVNDGPPVALSDSYAATEDTLLTVTAANGVLANDTDVDGDPLTAILDFGASHGTIVLNPNGSFNYTPNANYHGADSFIYHANDGTSNSAPALVTLTIASVNDGAPVATADSYVATEGTTFVAFAMTGVLANDTDPDGEPLTAVLGTGPSNGTLLLNADGSFAYTPTAGFSGADSFTYHANDGTADSNTVIVTLAVTNVNAPPVASNDTYFINEDAVLTVAANAGVLVNDLDPDSDPMTAVLVTPPLGGTLVLNSDGSFVYTPNPDFNGSDSFTYRANDGTTNGNLATVTITVNPQNEAPIIITSPGVTTAKCHKRTILDPAINLIDLDSPSFATGHLDVAIQSGLGRRDTLGYRHGGANKGRVNSKQGNLRIGRTVIGSISGGLHGTPLHVELNSNATQERVEVVMQNLIFRGTHGQPGPRVVSWQITDDTGLSSNVATKTANVT